MNTLDLATQWQELALPEEVKDLLTHCPSCIFPHSRKELLDLAMTGQENGVVEVAYEVPGKGRVVEATVTQCKNALVVNYPDPLMRRRDPDCMVVADAQQTDKARFRDRFGEPFDHVRSETLDWLRDQKLIVMAISLGAFGPRSGQGGILVAPDNAAFFAAGLADLQGLIPADQVPAEFKVRTVIYLAPPLRHTHFGGKQVVVHKRGTGAHEVFAYNLYPGPSAKKGVYGVLLSLGESGEWPTLHASTVEVVTPYDNVTTIMHEAASGGGKSEMLEYPHRESDGRLLIGRNVLDDQTRHMVLTQNCRLRPVTDDMAMCRPNSQNQDGHLVAQDAEQAWFIRINHIEHYGTDPHMEEMTIHTKEPLIMFNIQAVAGSTCLIWEHIEDSP
ncbi:MAG: DUF4914 family protein, partial [Phycisphaerae bacterium]|nr:DUF4914 family protein [Phycisphaerae bacterium]